MYYKNQEKMKIAITSSNGKNVDTHFGKAKEFYIYDITPPTPKLVEKRESINYCSGVENHGFMPDKLEQVYKKIADCKILCTAKIGETPTIKLEQKGINVIEFEGSLEDVFDTLS